MYRKTLILSLATLIVILAGSFISVKKGKIKKDPLPANIILFIGDGMGPAHLYAGMTVSDRPLYIEKFSYSGYVKTWSFDKYITDSAAAGTAIACGVKTRNGMIGTAPDSTAATSIMEIAHRNGLATGLVSTSSITHATPASFVSHNTGRGNYEDIARDFLNGTIDVFIGGGENHFRNRKDGVDLCSGLASQGYDVVYNTADMKKSNSGKLAALLSREHMPKASEGREGILEEMTAKAIEILSRNKKGFILMVEGSMIDWGAHENNLDYVVNEVIDMDKAVGKAVEFSKKNGNTLVIVTADHETGGLSLTGGNSREHKATANFSVKDHTAAMVPVFSMGPGSERFSGIIENTFFKGQFVELLKLKE
jgi:alkaline phosphatase